MARPAAYDRYHPAFGSSGACNEGPSLSADSAEQILTRGGVDLEHPSHRHDGLDISTLSLRDVSASAAAEAADLETILNIPTRSPPPGQLAPLKRSSTSDKLPVSSLFTAERAGAGSKNFRVAVRVRPLIQRELVADKGSRLTVAFDSETSLTIRQPREWDDDDDEASTTLTSASSGSAATVTNQHTFSFDRVYDPSVDQEQLFSSAVEPVVSSILEGYNGSIICYGQTGTGKTHTVEGGAGDQKGIIPRASDQIFGHIENKSDAQSRYLVRVSFLQIYNEKPMDLLFAPKKKGVGPSVDKALRIRRSASGGVTVQGLSEHIVRSSADVAALLVRGGAMRATAQTNMNIASSRSHAVFTIIVECAQMTDAKKGGNAVTIGKLNLVDLAGSERLKTTGVTGKRLEETKKINASLSAFGTVILALTTQGRKHIPYRDSTLTQLLQDSLGGNCKTTMITTITAAASSYSESVNTLNFANRAKKVKNYAMVNQDMSEQALLSKYEKEIKRLQRALQEQRDGGQLVDRAELERVESKWAEIFKEKEAVISELERREQEVEKYATEKTSLEERIAELESKLVVGGTHADEPTTRAEDTEEFQDAVRKKEEQLHQEYVQKVQSVEQERKELARARELLAQQKEEVERERVQLATRAYSSAGDYTAMDGAGDDSMAQRMFEHADSGTPHSGQWAARRSSSSVLHNTWVGGARQAPASVTYELDDYIRALRNPETGIPLRAHSAHGPCFTGNDAAVWFTQHMQGVTTLEAAVDIGNRFIDLAVIGRVEPGVGFQARDDVVYIFTPLTDDAAIPKAVSPEPRPPSEMSYYSGTSDSGYSTRPQTSTSGSLSSDGMMLTFPQNESPDGLLEEDAGSNALHAATAKGDRSAVKQLIPAYGVECTDHSGRTPLMYAVIGNRHKVCDLLIKSGANLLAADNNGRTPLLCASYYGNAECMRVLLGQKSSLQAILRSIDIAGRTALHWSMKTSNIGGIQLLAKCCSPQITNAYDDDKTTAVHWAVLFRRPQHLQVLLRIMMADASLADGEGRTGLHYAVSTNQLDCAKLITDQWPGILNQKDKRGRTALHVAVLQEGAQDMMQHILSCSECDVNAADARKSTPLHWAAVSNRHDVATTLLKSGAKVMMRDSYSMTPLHYAIQKGHRDMASLLQRFASNKHRVGTESSSAQAASPSGVHRSMHQSKSMLLTASTDQLLGTQSAVLTVPESRHSQMSSSPKARQNGMLVGRRRSQGAVPAPQVGVNWRDHRSPPQWREQEPI